MTSDHLGKSKCSNCGEAIEVNDDRIVVMAVEVRGEEAEEAGRGESYPSTFCNKCAADLPEFTFQNPWKALSDFLAAPSAGRSSEDLMANHVSLDAIAERRRRRSGRRDQSDGDALGALLSDQERHDSRPPDRTDIAIRTQKFLCSSSPKVQQMGAQTRAIGALLAFGLEQRQVAELVGLNRSTVSREWEKVQRGVQKA